MCIASGIENIYQLEQLAEGDPKSLTAEDRDVMKAIEVVHKDKEDRENRITLFGELKQSGCRIVHSDTDVMQEQSGHCSRW